MIRNIHATAGTGQLMTYSPSHLGRLSCPTCAGSGAVCEPAGRWDSCDVKNERECPPAPDGCEGTGFRLCEHCGDEPSVGLSEDGDAFCKLCLKFARTGL